MCRLQRHAFYVHWESRSITLGTEKEKELKSLAAPFFLLLMIARKGQPARS